MQRAPHSLPHALSRKTSIALVIAAAVVLILVALLEAPLAAEAWSQAALIAPARESTPRTLEILPIAEETRLALSAAPEHLREGAGVAALTAAGFVNVQDSENGFTCVVNRDHPLSRKPTCYDAEGTATILPKVEHVGELLLSGLEMEEIWTRVNEKFESGEFIAPRRPGIAYMLSNEIRNYNPQTGEVDSFPPHLMFYGPNLTDEDIGTSWEARKQNPWLPFVGYQGPHGFMIVVVESLQN